MWKAKARLLGVKCALPDLFATPVLLTLVAEDGRGRIVDGVFLEGVVDVTKLGATPDGFSSLGAISEELAAFIHSRKFRRITAIMPPRLSVRMERGLARAGFREQQLRLWDRTL